MIGPGQLDDVLHDLGDRHRVLLFTLEVPRSWQDPDNETLRSVAAQHSDVVLVDWQTIARAHTDWLYSDGIHLTPEGAAGHAGVVSNALAH